MEYISLYKKPITISDECDVEAIIEAADKYKQNKTGFIISIVGIVVTLILVIFIITWSLVLTFQGPQVVNP
jgi:uncharacterized integral membrane protein